MGKPEWIFWPIQYNQYYTPVLAWRQHGVVERIESGSKRSIDQEQIHLCSLGVDVTLSKVRKIRPACTYLRMIIMIMWDNRYKLWGGKIKCFKKNTLISPPFYSEVEVRVSSDVRRQSQVTLRPLLALRVCRYILLSPHCKFPLTHSSFEAGQRNRVHKLATLRLLRGKTWH